MSLHTKVCLVVVGSFLASLLVQNESRKLHGYKFPVYATTVCPRNETEWIERSSALNCNKSNGYTCLPNENFDQLLEYCYIVPVERIQKGFCLYLVTRVSRTQSYSCRNFAQGCHNHSFFSNEIYKYPACISLGNGCFLAEPSCKSITPPHIQSTTQQFKNASINKWNGSTTTHPQQSSEHPQLDNTPISDNDDALFVQILLGILTPICILSLLSGYYIIRQRRYDVELHEEDEIGPLLGNENHSINGLDFSHEEEECTPSIEKHKDKINQGIMSSSHMDVVPNACIDVLDIMADDDFNFEESIFNLEVKEFGYVANMGCPVADCNFQGTFPSRAKFQRHLEERHVRQVQKWACPHQGCKALVRRKSDMKSHLKFTHKETNPSILGLTIAKATSQMVRATNFIDPGLLKYNFRRAETFPTAGVLSLPGFPSMANVAPGTVVIPPPVIEPSSSLEPSSSSLEPSSSSLEPSSSSLEPSFSSVQTSSPELDPSSSLLEPSSSSLDPSSLPLEPSLTLEPSSLMAAPLLSTMELASVSTQTDSKKISLDDYLHKPQSKSTQTYSYCDDDFAIPPIPSSEDSLQMYIVKLGNQIDRIARVRLLAKERLERLQRPGSSLRELESENRALKRKITELLEREELFPEP